ncbi:MAG: DUF1838 family protein [Rhodoferax sp.]|jgi:hypothetical protein|nr:DUF1838 family protein [Chromatiales bacterium]MBP6851523.1 DUF1838 family protein [Rhodoferax sp.]
MTIQTSTRRGLLGRFLAASAAVGAATLPLRSFGKVPERVPLAFDDPVWNREMYARIEGDTAPGKFIFGQGTGVVHGVRDGEAVKPLFGFELFSTHRVLRQADGSYQRLCRELVFYRDLATGQLLDQWRNPYTGEQLRVVDIANDPFNYVISEYFPDPPSYGGLNKDKPPKRPLRLNWGLVNDTVTLDSDIHLYYRNALDPARWPRESAGPMNRVSELFRYFIRREDAENPELTHMPHNGVWSRVTPWLPWMLMGQAPGHALYMGRFTSIASAEQAPPAVLARVRERYPLYLTAPDRWVEPSYSSLENYARTQEPAPPRAP